MKGRLHVRVQDFYRWMLPHVQADATHSYERVLHKMS